MLSSLQSCWVVHRAKVFLLYLLFVTGLYFECAGIIPVHLVQLYILCFVKLTRVVLCMYVSCLTPCYVGDCEGNVPACVVCLFDIF